MGLINPKGSGRNGPVPTLHRPSAEEVTLIVYDGPDDEPAKTRRAYRERAAELRAEADRLLERVAHLESSEEQHRAESLLMEANRLDPPKKPPRFRVVRRPEN